MPSGPGQMDKGTKDGRLGGFGQVARDTGPYLTLGIQLAAAVLLFFLIGWWLDSRYDSQPLFMLIGVVVGFVGGMIKFLKSVTELSKKS